MRCTKWLNSFAVLTFCFPIAAGLGIGLATTSEARQQPQPTFGSRVDLIQLDVSVLDKHDQPVHGLTQADFALKEDGQAQPVQTFAAIDLPDTDVPSVGWTRGVAPDVTTNTDVESDRLIVVLMDSVSSLTDPWQVRAAKSIGHDAITQLGSRDLAAVVDMDDRHSQEFTYDRARLLAAVDRFDPGGVQVDQAVRLRVLHRVVDMLGGVKQRRKAVVWVNASTRPRNPRETYEWNAALAAALLGNVNIYPIDPSGLSVPNPNAGPSYGGGELAGIRAQNDFNLAAASNTGGHAFINSNEFTSKVQQIFRETGSFYLLGYASSHPQADGKFHRLEVKVNRPGVTVHTRAGYYAADPPDVKHPVPVASPEIEAMADLIPKRDVPLTMAAAPFPVAGTPKEAVALAFGMPGVSARADDLNMVVSVFDAAAEAKLVTTVRDTVRVPAAPDAQVLMRVDLLPGRYEVRASLTSAARSQTGSIYADLDVPDFAKDALSLSGVVVSSMPAPSASPARAFADFLSDLPITTRTFGATDYVTAFFRVTQGGSSALAPVSLSTRIVNDKDAVVATANDHIDATQFDATTRTVDHRYRLPLQPLPAGAYLLTFEATLGKTSVRRDVRFTVH